jgi:hypothetical protein
MTRVSGNVPSVERNEDGETYSRNKRIICGSAKCAFRHTPKVPRKSVWLAKRLALEPKRRRRVLLLAPPQLLLPPLALEDSRLVVLHHQATQPHPVSLHLVRDQLPHLLLLHPVVVEDLALAEHRLQPLRIRVAVLPLFHLVRHLRLQILAAQLKVALRLEPALMFRTTPATTRKMLLFTAPRLQIRREEPERIDFAKCKYTPIETT